MTDSEPQKPLRRFLARLIWTHFYLTVTERLLLGLILLLLFLGLGVRYYRSHRAVPASYEPVSFPR